MAAHQGLGPLLAMMPSKGSQLAKQMRELGVACTQDESAFSSILRQSCASQGGAALEEQDVAEVLIMMAQTQHAAAASSSSSSASVEGGQSVLAKTLAALMNPATGGAAGGGTAASKGGEGKGGEGKAGGSKGGEANSSSAQQVLPNSSTPSSTSAAGWNWRTVMDVIKAAAPSLNWARVAELMDHPSFSIPDEPGFTLLASAYRHAAGERLPARAFIGRVWDNHTGQLSFLRLAVTADPELFSFQASERKAAPLEGLQQAGKAPTGTPNEAWLSIDLQQVLCYLFVEPAHQPVVRQMLQSALKECPEVRAVVGWGRVRAGTVTQAH